jgi:exonuclease III
MDNLISNRTANDSGNTHTNQQSSIYINNSKRNSPNVDMNSVQLSDYLSDKLKPNNLIILHQNIRGLFHKIDEFLISVKHTSPHILCLTEHHLRTDELKNINLRQYTLGTQYCRKSYKQGGVAIYVSSNIQFYPINLDHFNKEKDIEICALKLYLPPKNFIILCIYRSPTGNFRYFINQLEVILNRLYKGATHLILCGDFNINHLDESNKKHLLVTLLASFNLFSTVTFPTRIANNTSTLIDNIYININSFKISVYPLINGLSHHDAQVISLSNVLNSNPKIHYTLTRRIDSYSTRTFIDLLLLLLLH